MTYSIKKQDGEFIVVNAKGVIVSYCDTRVQAEDIAQAQTRDNERSAVEAAFNSQQQLKALRAEFIAEFA